MASLYKRSASNNWYVSYFLDGKRVVKSFNTPDEKLARFLKKELEVKLRKGLQERSQQTGTAEFFEQYVASKAHRKSATNRNEFYVIKEFLRATGKKTINGIKETDVRSFLRSYESKAPQTFNNIFGALKRFFVLALGKGYMVRNPVDGIQRIPVPQSLPRFFTDEEYMRIERAAEGHPLFPMIVTARYTGLRLRELIHLEWQDFDWEKKVVQVLNKPKFNHTVKNYQARVVPISDELRDKLLPFIKRSGICFPVFYGKNSGAKYSDGGPREALSTLLKKAGIDGRNRLGWHEFRHTFASRLVQNNVAIYKVSKWLGHSSLTVTQIYAHFAPVYDQDIEKLSVASHSTVMPTSLNIRHYPTNWPFAHFGYEISFSSP